MSAADPHRFIKDDKIDIADVFTSYKDRPAVIHLTGIESNQKVWTRYTYGDVFRILHALDCVLCSRGVRAGSRVALYADNGPLHYFLFFLAWIRGDLFMPLDFQSPVDRVLSPVDAGSGTSPGIQAGTDACADQGLCAFILQKKDHGSDAKASAVTAACAGPNRGWNQDRETTIILDADDLLREVFEIHKKDLLNPESSRSAIRPAAMDRECSLVFTSGSTGRPLGVVHTVGNHVYSAAGVISFFGLEPGIRWLVSLPLNHVGGLSIFTRMFLSGGAVVFPESRRTVEAAIKGYTADCVSVVPTQLIRFMASDQTVKALASMRLVLLGGAAPPAWAITRALDLGIPVVPSYGSTESCSLVTAVAPGSSRAAYKTAGKVLPHRQLSTDPAGRIRLSGETRFSCYIVPEQKPSFMPISASGSHFNLQNTPGNPADKMFAALDLDEKSRFSFGHTIDGNRRIRPFENGWFTTSDLGAEDENGNWRIYGRADEIFISGGENINPFEIEQSICAIDGIDTAVVVPAPHEAFGFVPWAFVAGSAVPDPDAIKTQLKKSLPAYKIPKTILFMEPGEAAKGIKVDRAYLKQKAADMAGKDFR